MLHVPGANPTRTRRQRLRLRRRRPDDPSVAMMSWTLPATSHPLPTSLPLPSSPFPTFLSISHWVSHAKVATFDFSVSAAAGNPVPQSQSFHILFSFFRFVTHRKQQLKICCILFAIFPFFICISLLFQFISKFSVGKTNVSFPPTGKVFYFCLLVLFSVCECKCCVSVCKCRSTQREGRTLPTTLFTAVDSLYVCNLTFKYINAHSHTQPHTQPHFHTHSHRPY